jgi:hypothetical protein
VYQFGSLLLSDTLSLLTVGIWIWLVLCRFKGIWLRDFKRLLQGCNYRFYVFVNRLYVNNCWFNYTYFCFSTLNVYWVIYNFNVTGRGENYPQASDRVEYSHWPLFQAQQSTCCCLVTRMQGKIMTYRELTDALKMWHSSDIWEHSNKPKFDSEKN